MEDGGKYRTKLEKAAQGVAQCEVSVYAPSCRRRVATWWKEQSGGHRIANISRKCGRI